MVISRLALGCVSVLGSSASMHTGNVLGYLSAELFPDTEAVAGSILAYETSYLVFRHLEWVASLEHVGLDWPGQSGDPPEQSHPW